MSKKVFRADENDFKIAVVNGRILTEPINLIDSTNLDGGTQMMLNMQLKNVIENFYRLSDEYTFCEMMDALDPESEDYKIAKEIWEKDEID